ncbi:MAG: glycosyltransferase [Bacteroidales bacterium]|nr:glycosyltransferase [Bacteroidales bacterium]
MASDLNGKRIAMAVTNDLVTDQRVHRACLALAEAGAIVTLTGRHMPHSLPVQRPYKTRRLRLLFKKKAAFYAEYNFRLLIWLLRCRADLFYANDTDTLPAVFLAAWMRRKPVFFDAHEMFPEVPELVGRPRVKSFWQGLENKLIPKLKKYPHGAACCTVCLSIANIYKERHGVSMQVVRNVPIPYNRNEIIPADIEGRNGRHLLLYQGAVNVGRGLEWLIDAMPLLDDCLMLIVGAGDILDDIRQRVEERGVVDRVRVMGRMPMEKLKSYTVCADLGLSLLENKGLNYYYSLPNRIPDFVQANVPVLATDFPEIRREVTRYGIGTLVSDSQTNPEQLALIIRNTLKFWKQMTLTEKEARFAKARKDLSWSHDKKVLTASVLKAFNH